MSNFTEKLVIADCCLGSSILSPCFKLPFFGHSAGMQQLFCRGPFSSTTWPRCKSNKFARSKALNAAMSSLETKIETASNKLLHLSSVLMNALTSKELETKIDLQRAEAQDNHDVILCKLDNFCIAEASEEIYRPATSAPAPSTTVQLYFQAEDEDGRPTTTEGLLKQSVLCSSSSELVTAAAGAMKHAYGVLGMAGVGKTVALQGLGHDEDILNRFSDGVHYMTFGQGATWETAIREIAKIMAITGASTQVQSVKAATSLKEAVDYAVPWSEGKICLYLLDDLWPAEQLPTGYLLDLRQLLRGSPNSRIAISTRSVLIASEAGCVISIEPRDVFGLQSFRIFMATASRHSAAEGRTLFTKEARVRQKSSQYVADSR